MARVIQKGRAQLSQSITPRREQIIKSATALFVKKGYDKTTVRDIASKSGITVGTLYHYITSKDDILAVIQERASEDIRDFIQETEKALVELRPAEALRFTIEKYFTLVDDYQDLSLFWYQETRSLPTALRARLLEDDELRAGVFNKVLMAGCEAGELRQHDTLLMAHDIIVLGDMWAFRRWFLRKHYTFAQYLAKQVDLILSTISNHPGSRSAKNARQVDINEGGER
jgi:AcrR family transcriptional regulator